MSWRVVAVAVVAALAGDGSVPRRADVRVLARPVPRHRSAPDGRGPGERLRVAAPRRADRYLRGAAGLVREPDPRDCLGGRDHEGRWPRQRPHRAGDGAAMGARRRERGDRRAAASLRRHARPRRHRGHAAGRSRSRRRRGDAASTICARSAPRCPAASSSSTSPTPPIPRPCRTAPAARGSPPSTAPRPCWCGRWAPLVCAPRTPAASATRPASRRFRRRRLPPRTPTASRGSRMPAAASASGWSPAGAWRPTWRRPTWWPRSPAGSAPRRSC